MHVDVCSQKHQYRQTIGEIDTKKDIKITDEFIQGVTEY